MNNQLPHSSLRYYWGLSELSSYLQRQKISFYRNGFEGFCSAVHGLVAKHRQSHPTFIAKEKLREIQVQNQEQIAHHKKNYQQACDTFEAEYGDEQRTIDKQLKNSEAAIQGISKALNNIEDTESPKYQALQLKLQAAQEKKVASEAASSHFYQSEAWLALQQAQQAYQTFCDAIGLTEAQDQIKKRQMTQASKSHDSGFSFENDAVQCAHHLIIPRLIAHQPSGSIPLLRSQIRVLTQVTLKSAQAELDAVIVRLPVRNDQAVKVLAVIEAKRNPNDIASGFITRQENLAWFSGDKKNYQTERYRTQHYTQGHFEGTQWHKESTDGQSYRFDPTSFSLFQRDAESQYFLDRLYFVTMRRILNDLPSDQKGLLQHYLSADLRFYDLSTENLHVLYTLMQEHQKTTLHSQDVLHVYKQKIENAYRIILLDSQEEED